MHHRPWTSHTESRRGKMRLQAAEGEETSVPPHPNPRLSETRPAGS